MPKEEMSYEQFLEMLDRQCGADYTSMGTDPCATNCDRPQGHYPETAHEGGDPFGGDGRITWRGGGSCVGDPLPTTDVQYLAPWAS